MLTFEQLHREAGAIVEYDTTFEPGTFSFSLTMKQPILRGLLFYELVALAVHYGSHEEGHYVSYVKSDNR